jgi:hypothetical protein
MKKLIALLISITFLTLPACNRSNIEQITGTTAPTEQSKEAINIVPDEKAVKEEITEYWETTKIKWGFNEYIEAAKSCCKWAWRNKEYIAGGTVAVVAIGLIAWGAARGDPAPKAKTAPEAKPANPPKDTKNLPPDPIINMSQEDRDAVNARIRETIVQQRSAFDQEKAPEGISAETISYS